MDDSLYFVCGADRTSTKQAMESLKHDVEFLTARIQYLENQLNTNISLIEEYREMLKKRTAVLSWIERENEEYALQAIQVCGDR